MYYSYQKSKLIGSKIRTKKRSIKLDEKFPSQQLVKIVIFNSPGGTKIIWISSIVRVCF